MISDYQILGIPDGSPVADIKRAYHRRVKQLHPDMRTGESSLRDHFIFVEVCNAYQRLLRAGKTPDTADVRDMRRETASSGQKGIVSHNDPAYAFYKTGIRILSKIHPTSWKASEKSVIMTEIGDDEENQIASQNIVRELITLFPKAYYYFSVVVNEYPSSSWAADSRDKMELISNRMAKYRKIVESFTSWKNYKQNEKDRFRKMMKETTEKYAESHDEMQKAWKETK